MTICRRKNKNRGALKRFASKWPVQSRMVIDEYEMDNIQLTLSQENASVIEIFHAPKKVLAWSRRHWQLTEQRFNSRCPFKLSHLLRDESSKGGLYIARRPPKAGPTVSAVAAGKELALARLCVIQLCL
jgi:hypothetical protein